MNVFTRHYSSDRCRVSTGNKQTNPSTNKCKWTSSDHLICLSYCCSHCCDFHSDTIIFTTAHPKHRNSLLMSCQKLIAQSELNEDQVVCSKKNNPKINQTSPPQKTQPIKTCQKACNQTN